MLSKCSATELPQAKSTTAKITRTALRLHILQNQRQTPYAPQHRGFAWKIIGYAERWGWRKDLCIYKKYEKVIVCANPPVWNIVARLPLQNCTNKTIYTNRVRRLAVRSDNMKTDRVITAMIEYFGSDKKRIHHFSRFIHSQRQSVKVKIFCPTIRSFLKSPQSFTTSA